MDRLEQQHQEEECLDIALTIEDDGLSLNPFDRPPNMLMDDDLNRVTQEELEANLSTDCPMTIGGGEPLTRRGKTNDIWEQLIQSVLEDNSTQESILNHRRNNAETIAEEQIINIHRQHQHRPNNLADTGGTGGENNAMVDYRYDGEHVTLATDEEEDKDVYYNMDILNKTKSTTNMHRNHRNQHQHFHQHQQTHQQKKLYHQHRNQRLVNNKIDSSQLSNILFNIDSSSEEESSVMNLGHLAWNGCVENDAMVESKDIYEELNETTLLVSSEGSSGKNSFVNDGKILSLENKCTQLSDIMNDHCYISQETSHNVHNLRLNLLNHLQIRAKGTKSREQLQTIVSNLVDNMDENCIAKVFNALIATKASDHEPKQLNNGNDYAIDDEISREVEEDFDSRADEILPSQLEYIETHERNERSPTKYESYHRSRSFTVSSSTSTDNSTSITSCSSTATSSALQSPTPSPPPMSPATPGSPNCHLGRTPDIEPYYDTEDHSGIDPQDTKINIDLMNKTDDYKQQTLSADKSPLFHNKSDTLTMDMNDSRTAPKAVDFLEVLKKFATNMFKDCNAFDTNNQSNIQQRLQKFIGKQWNEWHSLILHSQGTIMVDAHVQTENALTQSLSSIVKTEGYIDRKQQRRSRKRSTLSQLNIEQKNRINDEKEECNDGEEKNDERFQIQMEHSNLKPNLSISESTVRTSSASSESSSVSSTALSSSIHSRAQSNLSSRLLSSGNNSGNDESDINDDGDAAAIAVKSILLENDVCRSPSIEADQNKKFQKRFLHHNHQRRECHQKQPKHAKLFRNGGKHDSSIKHESKVSMKLEDNNIIKILGSNSSIIASLSSCSSLSSSTSSLASSRISLSEEKKLPHAMTPPSVDQCDAMEVAGDNETDSGSKPLEQDVPSLHSESDKENKRQKSAVESDETDQTDREIERLINLDGLEKRSMYTTSGNNKSTNDKLKNKLSTVEKPNSLEDSFSFLGNADSDTDESKNESDKEMNTEGQYLLRLNEEIKNNLLYESSTNSEEMDEEFSDHEPIKFTSSDDEEAEGDETNSESSSPLVTKFLNTIRLEKDKDSNEGDDDNGDNIKEMENESEDDNVEMDDNQENLATASKDQESHNENNIELDDAEKDAKISDKNSENDITSANSIIIDEDVASKKNDEEGSSLTSLEIPNSTNDIEAVANSGTEESKQKESDKDEVTVCSSMDTEKRKRFQQQSLVDEDLISLSSESSNGSSVEEMDDAETVENTKVRAIKPMLRPDQLASETIKAQKSENERIARLEKKNSLLNKLLKDNSCKVNKDIDLVLDYIKETKTFIRVHSDIVKLLKHHQCDGIRFMYDSCYGGVDSLKKNCGSGCILAHCMGLGKTLQLVALFHTLISYKELKTTKILVLCPKSTVMNWSDEIYRWLEPLEEKNLNVFTFTDTSDINDKLNIMRKWSKCDNSQPGCLLIGYEAFRSLVFYHSYRKRSNMDSSQLDQIRRSVMKYLLNPGADLVVCDEGHIIKNSKSAISLAVAQIATPRRIILTGTPIQNNLKEYYSMVNFIKPLFLGTEKEFANLYANPIRNGQHKDSSKNDIKIMKQRSFVLHKKLSKFVQRKEAELLKTFLPAKFEYVLFVPMTEVQNNLYTFILNTIANREDNHRGRSLVTDYTCLRKIWTHPKVLEDAWKNAVNQKLKKEIRNRNQSDDDQPDDIYDSQTGQMSVINDWWRHLLEEPDLESIISSNKLRTMFNILQMCEEKGEKCLIFSAFVAVLNVVEFFFQKITTRNPQTLKELHLNENTVTQWIPGKDYYRLDGKTPKSMRHDMIKVFNSCLNKRTRVFLISAKAGGQGINLIGANRVIILDTSWNPSSDQQNIFRVFRLGQKRNCYIYRLLAMGTMEEKVYSRSVTKQAMSFRVVDEQQIDRHYSMAELTELYTLTRPDYTNRPTPILPQDSILARLLRSFPDLVFKYHEHDSLLENKMEQELSEQEKNEAWAAYERDLQVNSEIREFPNPEDFHNNMLAAKLPNYVSPFTGLDVSSTNNTTNNNVNNTNMSSLLPYRNLGPPFMPSLVGQNLSAQQYLELYSFYKSLGAGYADMNNSYASSPLAAAASNAASNMMNCYPMVGTGASPGANTNPLAALGDLSMLNTSVNNTNLTASASGIGVGTSSLVNMPKNPLANLLPSAVMTNGPAPALYTPPNLLTTNSPSSNTLVPTCASVPGSGNVPGPGGVSSGASSILSVYEQYAKSLRNAFPNMYNYGGDFSMNTPSSSMIDKNKNNFIQKISHLLAPTTGSPLPPSSSSVPPLPVPSTVTTSLTAGNGNNLPGGLANDSNLGMYQTTSINALQQQAISSVNGSPLTAHTGLRTKNMFPGSHSLKDPTNNVDLLSYKMNDHRNLSLHQLTNEMQAKGDNYMDIGPSLQHSASATMHNKTQQQQPQPHFSMDSNLSILQSGSGAHDDVTSSTVSGKGSTKRKNISPASRNQSPLNNGVLSSSISNKSKSKTAQHSANDLSNTLKSASNNQQDINSNKNKLHRVISNSFIPTSTVFSNEPQHTLTTTTKTPINAHFSCPSSSTTLHPMSFSNSGTTVSTVFSTTSRITATDTRPLVTLPGISMTPASSTTVTVASSSPYSYLSGLSNTIRISPKASMLTTTAAISSNNSSKQVTGTTGSGLKINPLGMVRTTASNSVNSTIGDSGGLGLVPIVTSATSSTNEMIIIPTTSPPGATRISKQFNDLSPSISLTAVKTTTNNNKNCQPNLTASTNLMVKSNLSLGISTANAANNLQSTPSLNKRNIIVSTALDKARVSNSIGNSTVVGTTEEMAKLPVSVSSTSNVNNLSQCLAKLKGVNRNVFGTSANVNLNLNNTSVNSISSNSNSNVKNINIGSISSSAASMSTLPNNITKLISGNALNRSNLTITTAKVQVSTATSATTASPQIGNISYTLSGVSSPVTNYSNSASTPYNISVATGSGTAGGGVGQILGAKSNTTIENITTPSSTTLPSLKRHATGTPANSGLISLAAIKKTLNLKKQPPTLFPATPVVSVANHSVLHQMKTIENNMSGGGVGNFSIRPATATITPFNNSNNNNSRDINRSTASASPIRSSHVNSGGNLSAAISNLPSLPSSLSICKTVVQKPMRTMMGGPSVSSSFNSSSSNSSNSILKTMIAGKTTNSGMMGENRSGLKTVLPTGSSGTTIIPPLVLSSTAASTSLSNSINIVRARNTGSLNIRPLESVLSGSSVATNGPGDAYIIETKINDKKLAIGTPTKSGGGTTVTKLATLTVPMKRKAVAEDPKFSDSNQRFDLKRSKN